MSQTDKTLHCLSCNISESEIPLVNLRYDGKPAYIRSRCLPLLIHHPEQLIGKLRGAENIPPAEQRY